jgi:hypothetical protein
MFNVNGILFLSKVSSSSFTTATQPKLVGEMEKEKVVPDVIGQ